MGAPHPAEARNDWVWDWSAIPEPLGDEAVPMVMEVYGLRSWATSETTRGFRNRSIKAVFLRRDGGNQEIPPGRWGAQKDHEWVLRAVIWAGSPDQ